MQAWGFATVQYNGSKPQTIRPPKLGQTVEGQTYERERTRNKRQRAWERDNPGMTRIDGRTREAREKKQKVADDAKQEAPQSSCSNLPYKTGQEPSELESSTMIAFDTEFQLPSHETLCPVEPNNGDGPSSDANNQHGAFLESEGSQARQQTKDFSIEVRGVELSEDTPVVYWPGGFITCVPFIAQEGNPSENVLSLDAAAVQRFAEYAMSDPPSFVTKLMCRARNPDPMLPYQARLELQQGNMLVLEGYEDPPPYPFSKEHITEERLLDPHHVYSIHDPVQRLKNVEAPQSDGQLGDFFSSIFDHQAIKYILDMPSRKTKSPDIIYPLDDGFQAVKSLEDLFASDFFTLKDAFHTRNWDLLHGAGVHTFEHHDAEGYCTFIVIKTGCKIWGIVRPKGYTDAQSRKALNKLNRLFIRGGYSTEVPNSWALEWEKHGGEVYAIVARPGDVVIMPPGTWHMVYTPVRSLATGGHFYTYETLHLTEMSRSFDHLHAREVTNTSHVSSYPILCAMMIYVLRSDAKVFYRKPLTALCRMIIRHDLFIASTGEGSETRTVNESALTTLGALAKCVATYFVACFGFNVGDASFLFEGQGWMDLGPRLDLTTAFADWDGTPLRRKCGPLKDQTGPTLEDIISQAWTLSSLKGVGLQNLGGRSLRPRPKANPSGKVHGSK